MKRYFLTLTSLLFTVSVFSMQEPSKKTDGVKNTKQVKQSATPVKKNTATTSQKVSTSGTTSKEIKTLNTPTKPAEARFAPSTK